MKFSTTTVIHRFSVGLLAASLLLFTGCSEERKLANKAEWLCAYDQLQHLDPNAIPTGADLGDYIHPVELEYRDQKLQDNDAPREIDDDPWADFDDDTRHRLAIARAEHTHCTTRQVHLFEENDVAVVEVRRNVPDFVPSTDDVEEATIDELTARFGQSLPRRRSEHTLVFIRTDDGWRTEVGIKERVIEATLAKLDEREQEIQRQLPRARQAEEEEQQLHSLTIFRVESASLDLTDRRQRWGDLEAEVSLRGTNRGEETIGRVDFEVTYRAPGKEAVSEEFVYDGRPIRSGETRLLQLEPAAPDSLFGDEITVDEGASLDVSVLRIYDRLNRILAEAGQLDPNTARESLGRAAQDARRLQTELDEIEARRKSLQETLVQWRETRFSNIDNEGFDIESFEP